MLCEHITVKGCRILADLDLQIARRMTGIERTEQWNQRINDRSAPVQLWKIEAEFFSSRTKIKTAIFRQRRGQRIGVAVIEAERKTMQRVGNFVSVGCQLRVSAHARKARS